MIHAMAGARQGRMAELDGIRGWAAISVVLFHIFYESLGAKIPALRSIWVGGFMNGSLAVCLFFVVSGAALSAPFYGKGDRLAVLRSALKRYPRLMVPILAASLLAFAFYQSGLMKGRSAAVSLGRQDWPGLNYLSDYSITKTLSFALTSVFSGPAPEANILPFLWTMPIEMVGSMLLFVYLACGDRAPNRERLLLIITAGLFFAYPFLSCFFAGSYLALLRSQWRAIRLLELPAIKWAMIGACIVYAFATVGGFLRSGQGTVVVAFLICYYSISSTAARAFFSNRLSKFLGKISFPMYLVHFIVLGAVLSPLVISRSTELTLSFALLAGSVTLCTSIAAAWLFSPVEEFSHYLSQKLAAWALGDAAVVPPAEELPRVGEFTT